MAATPIVVETLDALDGQVEDFHHPEPSPARKHKLTSLVLGDGGFETMMRQRTQMRKEKEEHSLAQVMFKLTQAEKALAMESQRRIQSTHAIQKSCTERIQEMEANFERILKERSLRMEERLVSVQEKLETLTARFEEDAKISDDIEARGKELVGMVNAFQTELSDERNDRMLREGRIMQQMDDSNSSIVASIEKETIARESVSEDLQSRIDDNERQRSQSELDLRTRMQNELTDLQGMIDAEKQERHSEDEEIILALNRYTDQLQNSLSVISS